MKTYIGRSVQKAAMLLGRGEVVAIPTETVYGLAANALSAEAVAKVYEVKNRPSFDPLIIHTDKLDKLSTLVKDIPEPILQLANNLMPGPLSILLEKTNQVPDIVTSGLPKAAIRMPLHSMTQKLLSKLDFPVAAPSANPFGYVSPTSARHVMAQLEGKIPYILDGGRCKMGLESTIVDYQDGQVIVLRKGSTTIEQIEAIVGPVMVNARSSSRPAAPGMLVSHYAPRVPVRLMSVQEARDHYAVERIGHIAWDSYDQSIPQKHQRILSKTGSLSEAAYQLFDHLRALDTLDIDVIVTSLVPEKGLGLAINDKLRRAVGADT